jgi:hypothetical protein
MRAQGKNGRKRSGLGVKQQDPPCASGIWPVIWILAVELKFNIVVPRVNNMMPDTLASCVKQHGAMSYVGISRPNKEEER